jgi:uncharacterized membrane protein
MMQLAISQSRVRNALLLGSLCLNVLLVTFIATRWLGAARLPVFATPPPQLMELVARRLPAADADILRRVYKSREAQFAAGQSEYAQLLLAAGKVLSEPQVDAAALRAAVTEARNKRVRIGDLAIETLLEAVPQMSVDGRRGLIAGIRAR